MYFLIFSILFGAFGCIEEKNMEGQIDSVKNYELPKKTKLKNI